MKYLFTDADNLPVTVTFTVSQLQQLNKFFDSTDFLKDKGYQHYVIESIAYDLANILAEEIPSAVNRFNNSLKPTEDTNA
jgi:hypothetical protein